MSSPLRPLNPISPEKMNQQPQADNLPSLPANLFSLQRNAAKGVSDVQSKVAFLNNLSRREGSAPSSPSSSGGQAAALQRAILGREEAESTLASVSAQLLESQSRERRISEQLELLLKDLQAAKERQDHERAIFEKEIRKVRKEAFRAGSSLVKLQEELKYSRTESKELRDEILAERKAKEKAKQEAFESTYALTGLTEELKTLEGRLRTAETNNYANTLEAQARRIHRLETERVTLTEGDLAFLVTPRKPKRPADDSNSTPAVSLTDISNSYETPPKRPRVSDLTAAEGQNVMTTQGQDSLISQLRDELAFEKTQVAELEDMIHFMNMECQFKICSCRIAEAKGETFIHDKEYADKMERIKAAESAKNSSDGEERRRQDINTETSRFPPERTYSHPSRSHVSDESSVMTVRTDQNAAEKQIITFCPISGTFRTVPSPAKGLGKGQDGEAMATSQLVESQSHSQADSIALSPFIKTSKSDIECRNQPSHLISWAAPVEATDARTSIEHIENHSLRSGRQETYDIEDVDRDHTTNSTHPFQNTGAPVSREEALAQIRARRGRSHSMKRSASTNDVILRSNRKTITSNWNARNISDVQKQALLRSEGGLSERRDLSAPVRMSRR